MTSVVELIRQARVDRDLSPLLAVIPYARRFGLSASFAGDELVTKMAFSEDLVGNSLLPALHGGTLGALLESACILTLLLQTESLQIPKTISLTTEYLRSAGPHDTFAVAEPTRLGRRIAYVRALAWQEDRGRSVAAVSATFLLRPPAAS